MTIEEILQYIKSELTNENTEIYLDVDDYETIVKALEQDSTTKKCTTCAYREHYEDTVNSMNKQGQNVGNILGSSAK